MRVPFLNKAITPQQTKIDPRARLTARVDYFREVRASTEKKVLAGIVAPTALDRARTDLADAERALAAYDVEQQQAAEIADHQANRGTALFAEAQRLDSEIESIVLMLERELAEAKPVVDEIDRDFQVGYVGYVEPFKGSPIVERLKFWARGATVYHGGLQQETGRFSDRLAEYRRIGAPPAPAFEIRRPAPLMPAEKEKRRRLAMQNSRARLVVDGEAIDVARS